MPIHPKITKAQLGVAGYLRQHPPCSLVMDESRRPEEHNPVTTTAWGDIVVEAMTITSEFLQKFLTAEGFQAIRREKQNTVASICEELNSIHDGNHTFF